MRVILLSLGLLLVVAGCGNTVVTMQATPTPIVTPSSAIARFVKLTALAYERDVAVCENPAAAGLAEQMRSAAAEMKMALGIAPPNDGSQRWRVAARFGECVASSTSYLSRLLAEARGTRSVRAGRKDLLAAAAWAQRAQTAYGAYLAEVKQPRARSAAPSPSPRPSSLASRGAPSWRRTGPATARPAVAFAASRRPGENRISPFRVMEGLRR